eukprot:TRINITY_DN956_c2_g1_i1.p1 TRINITY_DN956_c2_g1~~TRINITY_DN956_c2_g1_i1.p1  ORF type:complete len:424 (+),score=84.61 TRINITY_DN956_c2_g1_i1:63-1334(+)
MYTRLLVVGSVVSVSLAGRNKNMHGGKRSANDDSHDANDNDDFDMVSRPPSPSMYRLTINEPSSSVDMNIISSTLQSIATESNNIEATIYPLFVCPLDACPNGKCPPKDQLVPSGCSVNPNSPPQPRSGAALATASSLLDFQIHTLDASELEVAATKISTAVNGNHPNLAAFNIVKFENLLPLENDGEDQKLDGSGGSHPFEPVRTFLEVNGSPLEVSITDLQTALKNAANINGELVTDVIIHFACPATACTERGCPETLELRAMSGCVEGKQADRSKHPQQGEVSVVDYQLIMVPGASLNDALANIQSEAVKASTTGTGTLASSNVRSNVVLYPADAEPVGRRGSNNDDDLKLIIAVICICVLVTACSVAALVYCCCCKKTKSDPADQSDEESQSPSEIVAQAKNNTINQELAQIPKGNDPY